MSSSSISVAHDTRCVLELLRDVGKRLTDVTRVVLPLGLVDSNELAEINNEFGELCHIMAPPLQVILTQRLLLNTDGEPLASDDQSPSYTDLASDDDPPILLVNDQTGNQPNDASQTGHQPNSGLQPSLTEALIDASHIGVPRGGPRFIGTPCGGPCDVGDSSSSSIAMPLSRPPRPIIPPCPVIAPLQSDEHSTQAALDTSNRLTLSPWRVAKPPLAHAPPTPPLTGLMHHQHIVHPMSLVRSNRLPPRPPPPKRQRTDVHSNCVPPRPPSTPPPPPPPPPTPPTPPAPAPMSIRTACLHDHHHQSDMSPHAKLVQLRGKLQTFVRRAVDFQRECKEEID